MVIYVKFFLNKLALRLIMPLYDIKIFEAIMQKRKIDFV